MTPEEYMQAMRRTVPTQSSIAFATLGLCSEVGELADIVNKAHLRGVALDRQEMICALGDILWYLACCADMLDATLPDVMVANITKLAQRYNEDHTG
jgi:NTP pyrophosphatase (non-canonical NTP hydrolase)